MPENPLEEVLTEGEFARLLAARGAPFHRLAIGLSGSAGAWPRATFFHLVQETDNLEALLDDHGARHNRSFWTLRELVASVRGLSSAGFSLAHLERRVEGYGLVLSEAESRQVLSAVRHSKSFLEQALVRLLRETLKEEAERGVPIDTRGATEVLADEAAPRHKLPRNVGQADLEDDEQKIAEIASRYLQASKLFEDLAVRRIPDAEEREVWLQRFFPEERARSFESTVHNLQSAYDTWVKNTRLESDDARLPKLRGHASAALHLLEAVTHLTHFVERHESAQRHADVDRRIETLVPRHEVRDVTLNQLLAWASLIVARGTQLAEDLLPTYTDVRTLVVDLQDGIYLHARPCALIAGVVNRHATPMQMQVENHLCNAGSILELMIAVGSHPDARRLMFRGDVNTLRDLATLFDAGLGERGIETLPRSLEYLRSAL